jgi:CRISPR-associated protein Csx10
VGASEVDQGLFSLESLSNGQRFHGEISCATERQRHLILQLLEASPTVRLGKSKKRGYGKSRFLYFSSVDDSFRAQLSMANALQNGKVFSIYLYSDTILMDRTLSHKTTLDKEQLAFWMGWQNGKGLEVYVTPQGQWKSFYRAGMVLGFNQHRRMPLPMDVAISKGSVFTIEYRGSEDLEAGISKLKSEGLGLRRNEGFGMVVVNHNIHGAPNSEERS